VEASDRTMRRADAVAFDFRGFRVLVWIELVGEIEPPSSSDGARVPRVRAWSIDFVHYRAVYRRPPDDQHADERFWLPATSEFLNRVRSDQEFESALRARLEREIQETIRHSDPASVQLPRSREWIREWILAERDFPTTHHSTMKNPTRLSSAFATAQLAAWSIALIAYLWLMFTRGASVPWWIQLGVFVGTWATMTSTFEFVVRARRAVRGA